ncbi:related to Probable carboxypeptidase BDBG_01803 [Cephalotrichum gorgonifer]|uniref:Related to Probable carboxypeptidase BDBG_01803 n=1 Tax=Cephalotrichum gorgonifer TaxID=2041049 RepID=A0AAE8SY03_9PEZI|nr:related to Probable carboxypeptidase BDBG_01803 [Cephalotrichum gorgonifer]
MLHSTFLSLALVPLLLSTASTRATQLSNRAGDGDDPEEVIKDSELLSLHRKISEIESISNTEQRVGEFLVEYLQSHDFTVEKQEVAFDDGTEGDPNNPRFNIIAYPSGGDFDVDVFLNTHIDTVPPHIPYEVTANKTTNKREDIFISGRGTVDAKAGVAALTIAAIQYRADNPDAKIGLLFTVGEENSGIGIRTFSDSDFNPDPTPYKAFIFAEPTESKLASGHKGGLGFTVNVTGVAGHSGYPWLYESAVSAALPVLSRLDTLDSDLPTSEKFGESTLNIGTIHAGVAGNVIPSSLVAQSTIRIAGGTPEEIEKIVRRAVKKVLKKNEIDEDRVQLTFRPGSTPVDLDYDVDGFDVEVMHYGTDISKLEIKGGPKVKRYLFGPGSITVAHSEVEGLTVGELEDSVGAYKRLIDAALA